jgi:hypothetical protein
MTSNSIRGLVAGTFALALVAAGTGTRAEPLRWRQAAAQAESQMKSAAKDVKDFWIKTKIHSSSRWRTRSRAATSTSTSSAARSR